MKTITVSGTNLWRVAAEHLGDASQWWRIAKVNNISEPRILGVQNIVIPDPNWKLNSGIPEE